jgi:hypothetical protein
VTKSSALLWTQKGALYCIEMYPFNFIPFNFIVLPVQRTVNVFMTKCSIIDCSVRCLESLFKTCQEIDGTRAMSNIKNYQFQV